MSDVIFGLAGPPPDPPVIAGKFRPFGAEGFSFKSLLDVVNPLQHLPIISGAYRAISGEEIGFVPRVLGGALFGGPIGLIAGLVNAIVKEASGRDIGETVAALVSNDALGDAAPAPQRAAPEPAVQSSAEATDPGVVPQGVAPQGVAPLAAAGPDPTRPVVATPTALRSAPARAVIKMPGTAPSGPLMHFRVPSVAEPTASPAARVAHRDPSAAEIPDRSPDWFMRSLTRGLEKYDRASRLERPHTSTPTTRVDG